jgi:inosine/xanthosine triphosphatase
MVLKVPRKSLVFHLHQNCQGSGVGSIPIGRSIFPPEFSSATRNLCDISGDLPLQSARQHSQQMDKVFIAIGSKRGPKLNAVREALEVFSDMLSSGTEFELVGVEVDSGVGHTPASREELMRGARQRAEALMRVAGESGASWQYFVGLEGGLDVVHESTSSNETSLPSISQKHSDRRVFLESWAYVSNGGQGHYGRSGGIELPESLAHEVLENGVELAAAIDRFAGAVGIRDAQGAWGVLSSNFITRQEAFRVAVVAAFAPFYNEKMYRPAAASTSGSFT